MGHLLGIIWRLPWLGGVFPIRKATSLGGIVLWENGTMGRDPARQTQSNQLSWDTLMWLKGSCLCVPIQMAEWGGGQGRDQDLQIMRDRGDCLCLCCTQPKRFSVLPRNKTLSVPIHVQRMCLFKARIQKLLRWPHMEAEKNDDFIFQSLRQCLYIFIPSGFFFFLN